MSDNDEEGAWRLWHLLQEAGNALWDQNEAAFMTFCIQEQKNNNYYKKPDLAQQQDDLPF